MQNTGFLIAKPLKGNFKISCDTKTLIGAQIYYLGEYEDYIKGTFEHQIKTGDTVLDIGANIGFHTLYFSELVGDKGKVTAFEPVAHNYNKLKENLALNHCNNVTLHQLALGDKNETLYINADQNDDNPGAFNLFEKGNLKIDCAIGDEIINEKIDFIKIDVEGYELFALQGLAATIKKHQPKIVFEFDKNYQLKTHENPYAIFDYLTSLGYIFYEIRRYENIKIKIPIKLISCDVIAMSKQHSYSQ